MKKFSTFYVHLLALMTALTIFSPTAPGQQVDVARLNSWWSDAVTAFNNGQTEEAQQYATQLAEAIPFEPSARIFLARCQAKQNNVDGALTSLAKAAELGWEDSASIEGYSEFVKLRERPEYKRVLTAIEQNLRRAYVLYVGDKVDRGQPAPLIVLYHGRGELPQIQLHFWKQAADQAGWIVLALKGTRQLGSVYAWEREGAQQTWQVDSEAIAAETQSRIKEVGQDFKISNLILTGFSQGSVAALETLRRGLTPSPIGAVLFSAAFPEQPELLFGDNPNFTDCRVSIHVGANDRWLKGNQATVDYLESKGVSVSFRVWENVGHHMPDNHQQVILDSVNSIITTR